MLSGHSVQPVPPPRDDDPLNATESAGDTYGHSWIASQPSSRETHLHHVPPPAEGGLGHFRS
jgi:hypothetical protein